MVQLQLELDAFTVNMLVYRKFQLSKFTRFHKLLKILETAREPLKCKITRFLPRQSLILFTKPGELCSRGGRGQVRRVPKNYI